MKIHYKIIVLDEETDFVSEQVLEQKRKYCIDYCCVTMKEAVDQKVVSITGKDLFLREMEYRGHDLDDWYFHPLKFCPFCGEEIEHIEEYRAKLVSYTAHIPAKTALARTERRTKEVKIET